MACLLGYRIRYSVKTLVLKRIMRQIQNIKGRLFMSNKVISIEVGRDFNYIISMYEDIIESIVYIPNDYKAEEIIETMLHVIPIDSPEDIICYDANGLGVIISDVMINNDKFNLEQLMRPIHYKEAMEVVATLDLAKEKLSNSATYRNLGGFDYLEFIKLRDEINNLEIKQGEFTSHLAQKDKSVGIDRARCYLNGLYILNNESKKIEDTKYNINDLIPEAIELYKMAYKSPPIGEDVDNLILQIISDFRESLEQGIKQSSTIIGRFLNESEEQYITDILMDKRYRQPSFLNDKYTKDSTTVETTRVQMGI